MLQVVTSESVMDADYPESLTELQQALARKALATKGNKSLVLLMTESMEVMDALNTYAWTSQMEPESIDGWINNHPIMFWLTNQMRNLTTYNPEQSLRRSELMVIDMANLEEEES